MAPIPLSLYIHIPWCVRKCPYCDFNSHIAAKQLPEQDYIQALLTDLAIEATLAPGRIIQTIFIGGGTPNLLSPKSIAQLLHQINQHVHLADQVEVTLETNPGAGADKQRLVEYRSAGVNRISLGVQSLQNDKLKALGRIHDRSDALAAVQAIQAAGFDNYNLDLMYGLPRQNLTEALRDLQTVIALDAPHLSWYQLTLEPHTLFQHTPPPVPSPDDIANMMQAGLVELTQAGYTQYEISAHAQTGKICRHNLNYWQFGDYLGIGAGAHSKLTLADGRIVRRSKQRQPDRYLALTDKLNTERILAQTELPLEFMLNAMRLNNGVPSNTFALTTGLRANQIRRELDEAIALGLLEITQHRWRATQKGQLFLNDLLALFM